MICFPLPAVPFVSWKELQKKTLLKYFIDKHTLAIKELNVLHMKQLSGN